VGLFGLSVSVGFLSPSPRMGERGTVPTNVVKTPADEKKWEKAKDLAAEAGKKDDWAYIMGIFKKMNPDRFARAASAAHVAALYRGAPSPLRVASRYLGAAWIPGEVRDERWDPGTHDPTPVPEGEGSQVPPARDQDGNAIPENKNR